MSKITLYKYFRKSGMNNYGACGLLANIKEESNFKSDNLQNTGNKKLGMTDAEYTKAVDDGTYTRDQFRKDKQGYGLCQWTYHTRKAALYDFAKKQGKSIGDELMQAEFLVYELKTSYKSVWKILCNAKSVREATEAVMLKFERPKNQSQSAINGRVKNGETIYSELCGSGIKKCGITLNVLKYGSEGGYVKTLQILLNGYGFNCGEVDGSFGSGTESAVKKFQKDRNLTIDGSVGARTWSALLNQ